MVIPLIGVSTYVADAAWGSWSRRAAVLPAAYYELVGSAGGRPLLLPPLKTAPTGPGFFDSGPSSPSAEKSSQKNMGEFHQRLRSHAVLVPASFVGRGGPAARHAAATRG